MKKREKISRGQPLIRAVEEEGRKKGTWRRMVYMYTMKSSFHVGVKVGRRMGNEAQQRLAPQLRLERMKRERGNEPRPGGARFCRVARQRWWSPPGFVMVAMGLLGVGRFCENFPAPGALPATNFYIMASSWYQDLFQWNPSLPWPDLCPIIEQPKGLGTTTVAGRKEIAFEK